MSPHDLLHYLARLPNRLRPHMSHDAPPDRLPKRNGDCVSNKPPKCLHLHLLPFRDEAIGTREPLKESALS